MPDSRTFRAYFTLFVAVILLGDFACSPSGDTGAPPISNGTGGGPLFGVGGATQGGSPGQGGADSTGGVFSATGGAIVCLDPEIRCGNECADTATSKKHCGACNQPCDDTEICDDGICGCPQSNTDGDAGATSNWQHCGLQCADLLSSALHCGQCYQPCIRSQLCINGSCGCPSTYLTCNGTVPCDPSDDRCIQAAGCYNPMTDKAHCGNCATACAKNEICLEGTCVQSCEAYNLTECSGTCVNTQNDPATDPALNNMAMNCGGCGIQCPTSKFMCQSGQCTCKASATRPSVKHCLDADSKDLCVDTASDPRFCGSCDNACQNGKTCQFGKCACSDNAIFCGADCFDPTVSKDHCGSCDNACGVGSHCEASACVCDSGLDMCADRCADYKIEPANCGGCGKSCGAGQACTDGKCQCDQGLDLCSGQCYDLQSDDLHCGSCAQKCTETQKCVAGACACTNGQLACGDKCLDGQNDKNNCGACGHACEGTQMCSGGNCTASAVKAQTTAQADGGSMLRVFLGICNAGTSALDLDGYVLKYWYSADGAAVGQELNISWSPVTPAPTCAAKLLDLKDTNCYTNVADAVITLTFGETTLAAGACTDAVQVEVHPAGWTGKYETQTTDYSYVANTTLKPNAKVTAYDAKGQLIWGTEPSGAFTADKKCTPPKS